MNLKGHMREVSLGVALVALLVYLFLPSAPASDPPSTEEEARKKVSGTAASILQGPDVDLALLTQQPGNYDGGGRNLFDYGVIKPPPPTPEELAAMAAAAEKARLEADAERKRLEAEREAQRQAMLERQKQLDIDRPPQAPREPPKPIPPMFPYKFIGVLGESAARIAIFLDKDDFLLAKEGEDVKEKFRIDKIGYDTLQIGYTDPQFKEESRILKMGKD
jgi:hypothetical protein